MLKRIESLLGVELAGILYGLIGIAGFSLTLPATKISVQYLNPVFVGFGRAIVAAILALILLLVTKQSIPTKSEFKSLSIVSLGVIVGFPLLSAWALKYIHASHGAIIIGIIPLATVIAGALRAGERPSRLFWLLSFCGSLIVLLYALISQSGQLEIADVALLGAVAAAALGYAEGGKLAQKMGGWRVISWTLVISAPFLLFPVILAFEPSTLKAPVEAWLGFAYVSLVSQFIAFFFLWYKGLALGGISKVGQVQLLQPFFTIIASALLLDEVITPLVIITMFLVALVVGLGKFASVQNHNRVS
ncbi:MAG TPA: DMT family transporter [Cytophagales bacterium]|nr:DMT family transporter [Cytophagales bacterium]